MSRRTYYASCGDLCDYHTGRRIRVATSAEERASAAAARLGGGAGVIGDDDLSPVSERTLRRAGIEAQS